MQTVALTACWYATNVWFCITTIFASLYQTEHLDEQIKDMKLFLCVADKKAGDELAPYLQNLFFKTVHHFYRSTVKGLTLSRLVINQ